jgi:NADH:ubiquinone oxidoreductase subunit 6 (subunit J)
MSNFPAATYIVSGIFILCLGTLTTGALIAVLSTRLIRSVCGLAICCLGLAGMYYFLRSPFLALMEILIYIGAVCVTIVFAIMLAEPDEAVEQESRQNGLLWGTIAIGVAGAIFWGLWQLGTRVTWSSPQVRASLGSVEDIGKSLLTTYSLAFEMISLALLVAILGALAIARTGRTKS